MANLSVDFSKIKNIVYKSKSQGTITPNKAIFTNKSGTTIAKWAKPFTFTMPSALPMSVGTLEINRTTSESSIGNIGVIVASNDLNKTVPIYYDDILTYTLYTPSGGTPATVKFVQNGIKTDTSVKVSGDVTVEVTANNTWHSLLSTTMVITGDEFSGNTFDLSALKASRPTRISGTLELVGGAPDESWIIVINDYKETKNFSKTELQNNKWSTKGNVTVSWDLMDQTGTSSYDLVFEISIEDGFIALKWTKTLVDGDVFIPPMPKHSFKITRIEQFY